MALASPRRVVDGLLRALDLPAAAFGTGRSLQLPGFSVAVGDMAAAVQRAGGADAFARIRWEPDSQIQQIISGWPLALATPRATALGFAADTGIDEVVQAFIEDDLEMQKTLG
jgi:D-erythronate 2-dehydrogenase